eukprot:749912-Prymnesium_polylepis.3
MGGWAGGEEGKCLGLGQGWMGWVERVGGAGGWRGGGMLVMMVFGAVGFRWRGLVGGLHGPEAGMPVSAWHCLPAVADRWVGRGDVTLAGSCSCSRVRVYALPLPRTHVAPPPPPPSTGRSSTPDP